MAEGDVMLFPRFVLFLLFLFLFLFLFLALACD
jgi:hypothetical protein